MELKRSSGVLLHPTSLPGPFGIGDLGPRAHDFVEFLHDAGCGLWQMLPLGPTGFDNSPYQSFSAFAGNPYLIGPEALVAEGLLRAEELESGRFPPDGVDFSSLIPWKQRLLDSAFHRFRGSGSPALRQEFEAFGARQAAWLEDFSLFMALKEASGGMRWDEWDEPLRLRRREALDEARRAHEEGVERQAFRQFLFFRQWESLRRRASESGIRLIGDVPIFVASDSADVWSYPELFHLDEAGKPTVVAGVPPDYFSKTGQLWGNPLYRWGAHAESGYVWWASRLRAALDLVDLVRLDHFRGFAACWEVPAKSPTAEQGKWSPGPGRSFLGKMKESLGDLPLIAEDLGVITPDVRELRDAFGLPGMKVLQFAFSGPDNPFLPHAYPSHCVVYTGTHDNDTSRGWYESAPEAERDFCRRYLGRDGEEIAWDLMRAAWASRAVFAVAPMQDLLDLGSSARMNSPGKPSGSWGWRMAEGAAGPELASRLRELNFLYQRTGPGTS
ncbi:MAG TPA: 4-alpha-glucanotransferase [Candidatus Polarisedimenticolia bacterium]|nr:4-alpha-glucanotransferase [Candidatus Polarisedimenticolia bacterium]